MLYILYFNELISRLAEAEQWQLIDELRHPVQQPLSLATTRIKKKYIYKCFYPLKSDPQPIYTRTLLCDANTANVHTQPGESNQATSATRAAPPHT